MARRKPIVRTYNLGGNWRLEPGDVRPDCEGALYWLVRTTFRGAIYTASLEKAVDSAEVDCCGELGLSIPPGVYNKIKSLSSLLAEASVW